MVDVKKYINTSSSKDLVNKVVNNWAKLENVTLTNQQRGTLIYLITGIMDSSVEAAINARLKADGNYDVSKDKSLN